MADTRALDILVGAHDGALVDDEHRVITRTNGAGFQALAERAFAKGMSMDQAFRPTTNTGVDSGGQLIIDWWLGNTALMELFDPKSYEVHVPAGTCPSTWFLDHRLMSARFVL